MITRTVAEFGNLQGKLREIARQGVELTVVSPGQWAGRSREVNQVKAEGYRFVISRCWLSGTTSVRIGNHLHCYPDISKVIRAGNWDLVHIDEEPFNLATYHALTWCVKQRVPAIFSSWQNMMKTYPPPFNLFERYVFTNAAGAMAGSAEVLDVLRRRGFRKLAVHVPHLGVDPVMFHKCDGSKLRRKLEVNDTCVVGFVGRLSPDKGLDTLIKAVSLAPDQCSLVIVGDGPERQGLERLAQARGISTRLRWLPWVNSWEVPEYMNALDVLVLPSRTRWNGKEQFGRVLVEAMACEVCVVGSDCGEIPNVVGNAGLIFHEDDERQLADRLRMLIERPTEREELGRRGRDRALQHFAYSTIAAEAVKFYERACGRAIPGRR